MALLTLTKNGRSVTYRPLYSSIFEFLMQKSIELENKTAIVSVDVDSGDRSTITYKDLLRICSQTAHLLKSLGLRSGDRVALLMHNTMEILLIELASGILGVTTVPLDLKRDTLDRKLFKLKDTGAKGMFIKSSEGSEENKILEKQTRLMNFSSYEDFKSLIHRFPASFDTPVTSLNNLYLILYTSGTTALPKGVPLTAENLFANAEGIAKWQNLTPKDAFNIILPLHHINSTTMSLATLISGGTVILNSRYSATHFWNVIANEKATITSVVPTIIHDLLVRKDEFLKNKPNVSSVKRILIGSAPVLPEETIAFYNTFGIRVIQGYGQTETSLRVTGVPLQLNEKTYRAMLKNNTIGVELTNCNVSILNNNGDEAKENEEGEIVIRGPVVTQEYLHNPISTKESFYGGWFHSGDLGYYKMINGVKYFFIVGRLKEIIIKGGVNLSPALIEDALLKSFPEIESVSVIGYPDARMGEEIAAVIVPKKKLGRTEQSKLTEKIISDGKNNQIARLSPYEAPSKVFFVDKLPLTSTGKIQRVEVKKMVAEKFKPEKPILFYVRLIKSNETDILKSVVAINNERWLGLPSSLKEYTARALNGLLFGVFDEKEGLIGSLSCVRMNMKQLKNLKTWNEATGNGTLSTQNPTGDTLICAAISVKSILQPTTYNLQFFITKEAQLKQFAKRKIEEYVNSNFDHVLEFHKKPKGGLPGANVWKILENGRPDDKEAMGYNVLMRYPEVTKSTKITHTKSSPSVLLIEHALSYAQKHGIRNVIAFSRPAGLRQYLRKKLSK